MITRQFRTDYTVENRRITFYPIVWNEVTTIYKRDGTQYRECLNPNMFDESLQNTSNEIVATINHDENKLLAKRSDNSLLLTKDKHGVFATCWLPENELGDLILNGIKEGKVTGGSCGWDGGNTNIRSDGVVEWMTGRLFDVCVTYCTEPAYKGTEVNLRNSCYIDSLLARYRMLNFKMNRLNINTKG